MSAAVLPNPISPSASLEAAMHWVRCCIEYVGPGFHPDTPFEDYIRPDGSRSFLEKECHRLQSGLEVAWTIMDGADCDLYALGVTVQRELLHDLVLL